jgi:protein-arginine kinase activator protein McsA
MGNALEEASEDIEMNVKSFIPCKLIYPYPEHRGNPQYFTCVEVSDDLTFFDFPSIPRNLAQLLLIDAPEGSYEVGMNIVDEEGNKIVTESFQRIEVGPGYTSINFNHSFRGVIFPKMGTYYFQLIVDNEVIYRYNFRAVKISRPEYTPEEVQNILEDPATIKSATSIFRCGCGDSKKFSLTLDPEKQKEDEKLPDNDKFTCGKCGTEYNTTELKSQMRFFLGSKNIVDTFDRNLHESRILSSNGFLNSSLIMQVSAFEAYMRDTFILNHKNWFIYLLNGTDNFNHGIKEIKTKIIHMTEQMKMKDQFYDQIFMLQNRDYESKVDEIYGYNRALKTILFGDDEEELTTINKTISFQQLKGEFGCFWAYKHFFGIDLGEELKRPPNNYFDHLLKSFKIRHEIIHGSSRISLRREVDSDLIKKNEEIILFIRECLQRKIKDIEEKRKGIEEAITSNEAQTVVVED